MVLVGCGDKAKDLYDTAQLEQKQFNKPHSTKLYRQIVAEYPDSPYANQAKTRLALVPKKRSDFILLAGSLRRRS
jgi:outer membrane protein assembly factor BamD (BamD/ComL family)